MSTSKRTMAEYHQVRIEALAGGQAQWGHGGQHHGNGTPECPRELHHHHDDFCDLPTLGECAAAGVTPPEGGWSKR